MKKRFSKVMLVILFLSVLTLVVIMTPLVKAQTISLSPSQGPVGTLVTVTVSGFAGGDDYVTLVFSPDYSVGSIYLENGPAIAFNVPQVSPGTYSITGTGTTGDSASVDFTVTATTATAAPTVAPTVASTVAPTVASTVAPTVASTVAPTVASTVASTVAPTPAIPEFPTWIILPFFAVMILLSTAFIRKRISKK